MKNNPDYMEMPCLCDCGQWFDLHDGVGSKKSNKVICVDCSEKESQHEYFTNELLDAFYDDNFRTLSWIQPYASLMLHGKIETRMRPTNVRGKVLICATKKAYSQNQIDKISGLAQSFRIGDVFRNENPGLLGKAIAVADLVACRPMRREDEDKCFVEYLPERWCWIFENMKQIEPFSIKGKQGWGFVTREIIEQIELLKP